MGSGAKLGYAWMVLISSDELVQSTLNCGRRLRQLETSGLIVARMSKLVSSEFASKLEDVFDLVLVQDNESHNNGTGNKELSTSDMAHVLKVKPFTKIIALHPEIALLQQSDMLFDSFDRDNGLVLVDTLGNICGGGICPGSRKLNPLKLDQQWNTDMKRFVFGPSWQTKSVAIFSEDMQDDFIDVVRIPSNAQPLPNLAMHNTIQGVDTGKDWIAVVGMSCRFPGANSIDEYWELLRDGRNTCGTIPESRIKICQDIEQDVKLNFLKCPVDEFDAGFFHMSPSEAQFTDPQARLLMEVSWEAFENAGINPDTLKGSQTGVYHGCWLQEYKDAFNKATGEPKDDYVRKYIGNGMGSTAAKLSFFYGFAGPNVATDSGCSASMIAVDLACKSLQRRECPLALVTGSNIILHMDGKQKVIWAPDGLCKTFDKGANGYARAEGIAVLVLKRYSDAIRDNDRIHGIIRGSAAQQEGLSKTFGAPTTENETNVMKMALEAAGVYPCDVDYVEAHATGTTVGDPIEAAAICNAYGTMEREHPLVIASGKTNIGHTESVSGLAGMIKVMLAFKHQQIPAHLHLTEMNPLVSFDSIPGIVPRSPLPWPRRDAESQFPRIAGVSSFGITGTDVHVIIQEPPFSTILKKPKDPFQENSIEIVTMSAKSPAALETLMSKYKSTLTLDNMVDVAFTANTCRSHNLGCRAAMLISPSSVNPIHEYMSGSVTKFGVSSNVEPPKICFTYGGHIGSMDFTPARQLYACSPHFRKYMDHCNIVWKNTMDKKICLLDVMHSTNAKTEPISWYACVVSIQYSLSKLWMSLGVQPDMLLAQCIGEVPAGVICGAISLDDAFRIIKSIEMMVAGNNILPGALMATKCDEITCRDIIAQIKKNNAIDSRIEVAAANTATQTLIAAAPEMLPMIKDAFAGNKIKCHQLPFEFALHSSFVDVSCKKAQKEIFSNIQHAPLQIPLSSSCRGKVIQVGEKLDSYHWHDVLRNTIQFTAAFQAANEGGFTIYLEIGLGAALTALCVENLETPGNNMATCLSSLGKGTKDTWRSLAQLYVAGVNVKWDEFYKYERCHRNKVELFHYPFQRKSFWFDYKYKPLESNTNGDKMVFVTEPGRNPHPLLGVSIPNSTDKLIWHNVLTKEKAPYIYDHVIGNKVIFPGAGFLEMILACGNEAFTKSVSTTNFNIHAPLLLDGNGLWMETLLWEQDDSWVAQVHAAVWQPGRKPKWVLHASAKLHVNFTPQELEIPSLKVGKLIEDSTSNTESERFYEKLADVGLNFGQTFKSHKAITKDKETGYMLIKVNVPEDKPCIYSCHPILIDAMIQAWIRATKEELMTLHVPVHINNFKMNPTNVKYLQDIDNLYILCLPSDELIEGFSKGMYLINGNGLIMASMNGTELKETTVDTVLSRAALVHGHETQDETQLVECFDVIWQRSKFNQPGEGLDNNVDILQSTSFKNLCLELARKNKYTSAEAQMDQEINELCALYVMNAFYEMGWTPDVGRVFDLDDLARTLQIVPALIPAFNHFASYLVEDGQIEIQGSITGRFLISGGLLSQNQVITAIEQRQLAKSAVYPTMETIHTCGTNLAHILQGRTTGPKVLFGQQNKVKTLNLAEHYYQTSRFMASFSELVGVFTCMVNEYSWDTQKNDSDPLRILEVGAGTGCFTQSIVRVLTEHEVKFQYHYTDISPSFMGEAKKKFQAHKKSFVMKTLNIEEDPLKQGFPPGYFDVVICVDVLHATRNLRNTLKNVEILTREGGTLLLLETGQGTRELDICFGILEGYWIYEDDVRTTHCTIPATKWLELLAEQGFTSQACAVYQCQNQVSMITAKLAKKLSARQVMEKEWILLTGPSSNNTALTSELYLKLISEMKSLGRSLLPVSIQNIASESNVEVMMTKYNNSSVALEGVLYFAEGNIEEDKVAAYTELLLKPLLHLSQYFIEKRKILKHLPRFHLVTTKCWSAVAEESNFSKIKNCVVGSLWGFMRTLRLELPSLISKSIDMTADSLDTNRLIHELWVDDGEMEICYDGDGVRLCRRLQLRENQLQKEHLSIPVSTENQQYTVEFPHTRILSDLKYVPREMTTLELRENEVEIKVRCTSLNFKDVLTIIASGSSAAFGKKILGLDYSGIVSKVGSGLQTNDDLKVGDAVFGCSFAGTNFGSHCRIESDFVMKMPAGLTFSEAATLPAVFITAWYCMVDLAQLNAGQTVLIHAATGGVGLIAIQIAKFLGVNVIATAGSERKRSYLRNCLGLKHVYNSRNTDFKDLIQSSCGHQPVDMVLNCLTGPGFKEASLAVIRDGGHFVEISVMDIWTLADVKERRPLVRYQVVNAMDYSLDTYQYLMRRLVTFLEKDDIKPLPCSIYPAANIVTALKFLQRAKHIGKVVLEMPSCHVSGLGVSLKECIFNDQSTYLITGGMGAIGFAVAKWMVTQGARYLVLVGRSEPTEAVKTEITQIEIETGARLICKQIDISSYAQCKELFQKIQGDPILPPLKGVHHCSGVLSDKPISKQDWPNFELVLKPKINGAWNLDRLTREMNCRMEFFVLYSSMVSTFGNHGQSNYNAANTYMDCLAEMRRAACLPALSIQWGKWKAGLAKDVEVKYAEGFLIESGIATLEQHMRTERNTSSMPLVAMGGIKWKEFLKFAPLYEKTFLEHINLENNTTLLERKSKNKVVVEGQESSSASGTGTKVQILKQVYGQLETKEQKYSLVKDSVVNILSETLGITLDEVEEDVPFSGMGLDSLMSIEFTNKLLAQVGDNDGFIDVDDADTVNKMTDHLFALLEEKLAENTQTDFHCSSLHTT